MMTSSNIESTFKAWVVYQGLNAHFTRTADYDYFVYNGKGTWNNIDSMEKSFARLEKNGNFSLQRKIFEDLGKTFKNRDALIFFYLSQFTNGIEYPSQFDTDLYDEYKAFLKRNIQLSKLERILILIYCETRQSLFSKYISYCLITLIES